jgi:glycosyltransferase involved in cell wall biosynthesis
MANFGEGFHAAESAVFCAAERLAARGTDAFFVVGEDLRQRYLEAGIGSADRYHVVRSPIETQRFREAASIPRLEARRRLGLDPGRLAIVYVGSLEARKGVLQLPAFYEALQRRLQASPALIIAGEGELRSYLEGRFEADGRSQDVIFLGQTNEAPMVLAAADCLVLLSRCEGLPQVLVQAVCAGTPFVCYPVDGARELMTMGVTGRIVPLGSVDAAADAVQELMLAPRPQGEELLEWHPLTVKRHFQQLLIDLAGAGGSMSAPGRAEQQAETPSILSKAS